MDISFQANALKLITRFLDTENPTKGVFPFVPKKPDFNPSDKPSPLPTRPAALSDVSPAHLADFLKELSDNERLDMHSVLIVKGGKTVCRAEWGDYSLNMRKITHSECKSVLSLVIGILIGDGKLSLDSKVSRLLYSRLGPLLRLSAGNMTVRHLLTMSTGVVFNEIGAVTEEDWLKAFFESARKFPLGRSFDYNSMNSYILSAIVREVSGQTLSEFTNERFFKPLGINGCYWEKSPEDIECGGFGLYIFPEDMARIGLLVLNGGKWEGRQIVPADYLREATSKKLSPTGNGDFDYGYHIWTGRGTKSILFNGMFGQNMLIYPENEIVIVANAANGETFQQGPFYSVCNRYFGSSLPKCKNPISESAYLARTLRGLKNYKPHLLLKYPKELSSLNGKRYILNDGKSSPAGLMPFILGGIRNYYTDGIKELSFSVKNRRFYIHFVENGRDYSFPVGFYSTERSVYDCLGEKYHLAVRGSVLRDGNGNTVLNFRFSFLEASNVRFLTVTLLPHGKISVTFTEHPDDEFMKEALLNFINQLPIKQISERLCDIVESERVKKISDSVFSPTLKGRSVN